MKSFIFLVLLTPILAAPVSVHTIDTLTFPPERQHVTGGTAENHEGLYPNSNINCIKYNRSPVITASRWHCRTTSSIYGVFLRIHHVRVHCNGSETHIDAKTCSVDFELDFTLLSVFLLGFVATALCGACLAATMWLAVVRLIPHYPQREESDPFYKLKEPGYGSFGRKLEVVGGFSGSFSSLGDFSFADSPPQSPRGERKEERKGGDVLESESYWG